MTSDEASTSPTPSGRHIARLILLYATLIASCFLLVRIALIPLRYSGWWWNSKDLVAIALPILAFHVALRWHLNMKRLLQHTTIVVTVSALIVMVAWFKAVVLTPPIGP